MKGATLTGFTLVALALCCGPCRGCCCSGALTDQFTDQLTDKLTEKVTEIAVQEGAEYAFEQIYGPDAHVELDISDRHASITKPGVKMDLWAMPETLPSRSQWPNPSNVTYIYDVEAEVESKIDGGEETQMLYGEVAFIEYEASEQEAVVKTFTEWAEAKGYTVKEAMKSPENGGVMVPGLEHLGLEGDTQTTNAAGSRWFELTGENKKGGFIFGPEQAQIYWEGVDESAESTFWWQ